VYHCGYEEEMMKKYNYNGNEKQSFEHMFFIKKVEKLGRKDVDGQQREVIMDLLNFVADWISSHILQEDRKFGEYLNSIGVN
ncbi:MAG: hemerythrin domain-containing protein, partial [Bacillota bacterium]|nr:hemerythrin domain-containing protein [Bacillota bacterium]